MGSAQQALSLLNPFFFSDKPKTETETDDGRAACNGSAEARSASTVSRTKEPARRFEPEITETFELLRQARLTNSNLPVSTFPVLSGLPEECKFEY
jgi:hypothetical protein